MKCVDVKEHLETFSDNEMSGDSKIEIAHHLDFCENCRAEFTKLRSVSNLLKKELPATPAKQLDAKVFAAFRQHHNKKSVWNWSWIFALKPAFALLTLCFLTGLAFLVGRMTAPKEQVVISTPPQIVEKEVLKELVKYVEVPTTKIVEIPIEKEKIVMRTFYQQVEKRRKVLSPTLRAANPSREISETAQQVDLRDFQPIGEIAPKILKKGEMDEK